MSSPNKKEKLRSNREGNTDIKSSSLGKTLHEKSYKPNISNQASRSKRNLKQNQSKLDHQQEVLKNQVLPEAKTESPLQKQSKTNIEIDTKNISSIEISICNKSEIYNKKRTKKITHTFWESKLTGARRVSKRLTNLRVKNKCKRTSIDKKSDPEECLSKIVRPIRKIKSKVQRSITLKVTPNKLKMNKNTSISNLVPPENQSVSLSIHGDGRVNDRKELSSNRVLKKNKLKRTEKETHPLHINPENTALENTYENNSKIFSESNKHLGDPFTASSTGTETVRSSQADQSEGIDDQIVHVDLEFNESTSLQTNVKENGLSLNTTGNIVENVTQVDCINAIQNGYESMEMEVLVVESETNNFSSDSPQCVDSLISREYHEENKPKQEKNSGSKDHLNPSIQEQESSNKMKKNTLE